MKILITGAKGQLGSELAAILSRGYSELGNIPEVYTSCDIITADMDKLDISSLGAVKNFVGIHKPNVIFNCAAMTNVDGCEADPELAMKVNAIGGANMAIAAQEHSCKLVHVSTDYVFAGNGDTPYTEWDVCTPQSVYGKSKLLGEQYVRQLCPQSFIVRTAWLYGYCGKNFVKTILGLAHRDGRIKVVADQIGNPTNAVDLAHHLLKLAVTEQYGTYHCTGTGECSWYDFACKIVELAGVPCETVSCTTEEFPRPAKRPAYSSLDNMMLRCTVGDEMRDWQDALAYFIENYHEGEEHK